MRGRGCCIGNAVTAYLGGLVHTEGQTCVQLTAHNQRVLSGQPLAGGGQYPGQPRHNAAHNDPLASGGVYGQTAQQKFHFGGIFIRRAAGPRDHAGGKGDGTAHQPADADVGIADINS